MHLRTIGAAVLIGLGAALGCSDDSGGPVRAPITFAMNPLGGSSTTSGTATITDQSGGASTVTVQLQDVPPGPHAGHVHRGTCAQQGAILFGLNPITPDSQANGSATTSGVPDALLVPGFYIQYHVALDPPGDPIACAEIPGDTTAGDSVPGY